MDKKGVGNFTIKLLEKLKVIAKINLYLAWLLALICAGLSLLYMAGLFEYKVFYINDSDSAPHGIYMARFNIQSEEGSGARMDLLLLNFYYLVELPVDVPALDKKAGLNLIKVCRALPGTEYTVTDKELITLGRSYPISDRQGLPHIKPGNYVVPENTVLFLNNPEDSFDSRYLGPIDRKYVKKVLYYIGLEEDYVFWGKVYAVSLILSLFIYLRADSIKNKLATNG